MMTCPHLRAPAGFDSGVDVGDSGGRVRAADGRRWRWPINAKHKMVETVPIEGVTHIHIPWIFKLEPVDCTRNTPVQAKFSFFPRTKLSGRMIPENPKTHQAQETYGLPSSGYRRPLFLEENRKLIDTAADNLILMDDHAWAVAR